MLAERVNGEVKFQDLLAAVLLEVRISSRMGPLYHLKSFNMRKREKMKVT